MFAEVQSSVLAIAFVSNDLPNLLLKQWYFVCDNVPHNVIVYTKITVYQSVSHSGHCSPVNVTVPLLGL